MHGKNLCICVTVLTLLMTGCSTAPVPRSLGGQLASARYSVPLVPGEPLGTPSADVRRQFRAALDDARAGRPAPPDSAALRGYVLYGYLQAARLQSELQSAPTTDLDARIDAFLRAHAGEAVVRDLRHDWLVSLAARARWDWFLPRSADVSDPLLICARLSARLATLDAGTSSAPDALRADALAYWSLPTQQPTLCDGVFEWLQQQGLLSPERTEARIRGALQLGNVPLALQLAATLPAAQSAPLLLWARLLQSPASTLRALAAEPGMAVEPQALQAGLHRLAMRNSTAAAALLPMLLARPDMTSALQGALQREVALGLAYDHDPAALALFLALPEASADDHVQQWRVRAALWSGQPAQALAWISALPPSLATQSRWQYWRARCIEAISGRAAAAPLYAALAASRDYYGYLAADRLGQRYDLQDHPTPDDGAAQATLAARAGLLRAQELFACGCDLYDAAIAEWALALAGSTHDTQVQAAHLAARWGWYGQAIATLAQANVWDDVHLRYPRPFPQAVTAAASLTGLPEDDILAVMRQESLFRVDAVSRADARGLMQLQPATADAVAQRWQRPFDAAALFDPAAAVMLGALHLSELLDSYHGQLAPALAAYNAGTTALTRWLPRVPMDADIWIENIPYDETRGYVQHILEHIIAYAYTRDVQPPRLAMLLPAIDPGPY